ncbi:hypothetical protein ACQKO6_17900 [Pseudomonas monteilii]|jgi:hypothetical protein
MAADQKRLMDSPLVQAAIKLGQSVAGAAIIGLGTMMVGKLDGIQSSINGFSRDIALVQRDLSQVKTTQDDTVKEVSAMKATVLEQGFEIKQLRKEADSRGR